MIEDPEKLLKKLNERIKNMLTKKFLFNIMIKRCESGVGVRRRGVAQLG